MTTRDLPIVREGDPVVIDGLKHRIRRIEPVGSDLVPVAFLAIASPAWRRTPIAASCLVSELTYDGRAGVWRVHR